MAGSAVAPPLWETDPAIVPVLLASAGMAVVSVVIHFAFIRMLIHWVIGRGGVRTQWPILLSVLALIGSHLVQIFAFAGAYMALEAVFGEAVGTLMGEYTGYRDLTYFSAIVYTTVGFGDIVPIGPERLLVATEALTGLVLAAWSASFTFLIMHRYMREQFGVEGPSGDGQDA
jgi:hypothetical protein